MIDPNGRWLEVRRLTHIHDESPKLWDVFKKHLLNIVSDSTCIESAEDMCEYFNALADNFLLFYGVYLDNELIGAVYFYNYDEPTESVSIAGLIEPRSCCFNTLALVVRECCVNVLTIDGIQRIEAMGRYDNRSIRIFNARVGFAMEGRLRSYKKHGGVFKDYYISSMIGGDYGR